MEELEKQLTELWKSATVKDGWGYDIIEADKDGMTKITTEWIKKNFVPLKLPVKPACDEQILQAKIDENEYWLNDLNNLGVEWTEYTKDDFRDRIEKLKTSKSV